MNSCCLFLPPCPATSQKLSAKRGKETGSGDKYGEMKKVQEASCNACCPWPKLHGISPLLGGVLGKPPTSCPVQGPKGPSPLHSTAGATDRNYRAHGVCGAHGGRGGEEENTTPGVLRSGDCAVQGFTVGTQAQAGQTCMQGSPLFAL